MKTKQPTYRELYLRYYAAFAQEEGKYQRLLYITRKIAAAVPVGHEVLEEWKDWEQQIEETEQRIYYNAQVIPRGRLNLEGADGAFCPHGKKGLRTFVRT